MPVVMRRFGQALLLVERGQISGGDNHRCETHPCAEELARSAIPPGETYRDFRVFDVHREHHQARRRRAEELYREDELDLSWAGANRLAYGEGPDRPSGYALVSMMNFLTPGSRAFPRFSEALDRLMGGALVPGGTILVLGAASIDYQQIYQELDHAARGARLTIVAGFDKPLRAVRLADERSAVRALTRGVWNRLESLAGDVSKTKNELRAIRAAGIFDDHERYRFPDFRVRAYRRGL